MFPAGNLVYCSGPRKLQPEPSSQRERASRRGPEEVPTSSLMEGSTRGRSRGYRRWYYIRRTKPWRVGSVASLSICLKDVHLFLQRTLAQSADARSSPRRGFVPRVYVYVESPLVRANVPRSPPFLFCLASGTFTCFECSRGENRAERRSDTWRCGHPLRRLLATCFDKK